MTGNSLINQRRLLLTFLIGLMVCAISIKGGSVPNNINLEIEFQQITFDMGHHIYPAWNKNGCQITYVFHSNNSNNIAIINVSTKSIINFNATESTIETLRHPYFCLNDTKIIYFTHIGHPLKLLNISDELMTELPINSSYETYRDPYIARDDSKVIVIAGHIEFQQDIISISIPSGDIESILYKGTDVRWPFLSDDNVTLLFSNGGLKYTEFNLKTRENSQNFNITGKLFRQNENHSQIFCLKEYTNNSDNLLFEDSGTLWLFIKNKSIGQPLSDKNCAGYSISPMGNQIALSLQDSDGYYQIWIANYTWVEVNDADTSLPWEVIAPIIVVLIAIPAIYVAYRKRKGGGDKASKDEEEHHP